MSLPTPTGSPADHSPVATVELFFDLVFVFALSQLTAHLVEDLSWRGVAETLVISLSVFTVWSFTTYESTTTLGDGRRTGRGVILATMALGLVMNSAIPSAFAEHPWAFVVPLVVIQVGRSLATGLLEADQHLSGHRLNMAVWACGTGALWIAGAVAEPEPRLWWWVAAVGLDVLGAIIRHPLPGRITGKGFVGSFDVPHQVERCQLFLIICLGEAVLTTGAGLIPHPQEPLHVLVALLSMGVIVSIWFLFFGIDSPDPEASSRHNDLSLGQLATEGQQVLVLGLVGFAVGNEIVSHHPAEGIQGWTAAVMFGGVIICTLAFWGYLGALTHRWGAWPSLLVGSAALAVAGVVAWLTDLPGWACLAVLLALMVGVCLAFARDARRATV